jgi:hypothetical protein
VRRVNLVTVYSGCIIDAPYIYTYIQVVRLGGKQRRAGKSAQEVDGAQLSVACVFFTQHTPKFGQHGTNPDTGKCWCYNLYGESKCWGCQVSSA